MLSKTIQCLAMQLVANKEGCFALLRLFGVVSGSFEPVLACYGLFQVVSLFKSDNLRECFDLKNLL